MEWIHGCSLLKWHLDIIPIGWWISGNSDIRSCLTDLQGFCECIRCKIDSYGIEETPTAMIGWNYICIWSFGCDPYKSHIDHLALFQMAYDYAMMMVLLSIWMPTTQKAFWNVLCFANLKRKFSTLIVNGIQNTVHSWDRWRLLRTVSRKGLLQRTPKNSKNTEESDSPEMIWKDELAIDLLMFSRRENRQMIQHQFEHKIEISMQNARMLIVQMYLQQITWRVSTMSFSRIRAYCAYRSAKRGSNQHIGNVHEKEKSSASIMDPIYMRDMIRSFWRLQTMNPRVRLDPF